MMTPEEQKSFRETCYGIAGEAIDEAFKFLEERHMIGNSIPQEILMQSAQIFMQTMKDSIESDTDWGDAFE